MNAEHWQKIKFHIDRIASVPSPERQALLEELGTTEPEMRTEVEEYLELEDEAEEILEDPLWTLVGGEDSSLDTGISEQVTRIGPYRLLDLLGRGGMGKVHLAVRQDDYEQKVAIKRTSGSVNREQLMARFRNERQILASLEHPNIARLLDGGTDEKGYPYLVMEYVEGSPIDQYCDEHDLEIRQRLQLFRKVCQAVHYAHQNLVVHRDLKPTNILIGQDHQPRLLDFGIAKLIQPSLDSQLTAEGQAPLTPACASPEQLMGEPVTTACDVYALGVLLYRLLSGQKPYELDGLGFAGLMRRVCFQDPIAPSKAIGLDPNEHYELDDSDITEIAPLGPQSLVDTEPAPLNREEKRLKRQLEGDLDSIVMKAMRKEPRHRYDSAADLADDIKNYLSGMPVAARKGNWLYQTAKHLRRNRPAVAILALIIVMAISSTILWQQAERGREAALEAQTDAENARQEALDARDEAQALSGFLTDMLSSADPDQSRGADLTVREVVDAAQIDLETSLAETPRAQPPILSTLSDVYRSLGLYADSLDMARKALEKEMDNEPELTYVRTEYQVGLGMILYGMGRYREAEQRFQQAIDGRKQLQSEPGDYRNVLFNLASAKNFLGKSEEVAPTYRELLEVSRQDPETTPGDLATYHYGFGSFYMSQEMYSEAIPDLEKALDYRREELGDRHTKVAEVMASLGEALTGAGDHERAMELLMEALEIRLELLGPDHPIVGGHRKLLARAWLAANEPEKARVEAEMAVEVLEQSREDDDWVLWDARVALGSCWLHLGETDRAEPLLRNSLEALVRVEVQDRRITHAAKRLIELYTMTGDNEKAREMRAWLEAAPAEQPGLRSELSSLDLHRP